jgi:hypothetical protein
MHLPTFFRRLVVIGTPLALSTLEIFHPMPGENFIADLHSHVGWWLTLHVLQLPLFGLMALAVATLLTAAQTRGVAAGVSRIALWCFAVFYIAFDSLAGVAAGFVASYASALPADQQHALLPLIIDLNFSPIAIGINALGALGWVTAVVAAAIALWQRGLARDPAILLSLSAIFALHTPPTGPLGLLFFALAAAWLEFVPQRSARSQPAAL